VIDETLFDAEEKMEKAVSVAKEELSTVRTGRATPSMFSRIHIDYYGAVTPLNQMAAINIPEARMAIVKPFGVNPGNDGTIIRVVFPQLSEERRKDMVKLVKNKGEDAKISIRNVRRKAKEELDRIQKDGEAGEDEVGRAEKELQHVTDRYVAQIDDLVKHKETELLEV
jgi:ribosome recycling factor